MDSEDEEETDTRVKMPTTHVVELEGHKRAL
jgi:hypothetical protein